MLLGFNWPYWSVPAFAWWRWPPGFLFFLACEFDRLLYLGHPPRLSFLSRMREAQVCSVGAGKMHNGNLADLVTLELQVILTHFVGLRWFFIFCGSRFSSPTSLVIHGGIRNTCILCLLSLITCVFAFAQYVHTGYRDLRGIPQ